MAHLNPLEKEFLIRQFKLNGRIKLSDFCTLNNVSDAAFRKWLRQYEEGGLEGLARADAEIREVLPEGIDRTEEAYKREILRLRIENERLKKSYAVQMNERNSGPAVPGLCHQGHMQPYGRKPLRLLQVEKTTSIQARHQPRKDDRAGKDNP